MEARWVPVGPGVPFRPRPGIPLNKVFSQSTAATKVLSVVGEANDFLGPELKPGRASYATCLNAVNSLGSVPTA